MNVAVVGHVEWCHFARVERLPGAGEIVHADEFWSEAAGGAGVAAVQLAKLAGNCTLFTAFGNDAVGAAASQQLASLGVTVHASLSDDVPTKEAFVHIDPASERAITVLGELKPSGNDPSLPWGQLAGMDAVYFVSGDAAALQAARHAKVLVATARVLPVLKEAGVPLEALVMSQGDAGEAYQDGELDPPPALIVKTAGRAGGSTSTGLRYEAEPMDPDDFKDSYGCGDSFAAGLTFALGRKLDLEHCLRQAAHCGAEAARRRGAHGVQSGR